MKRLLIYIVFAGLVSFVLAPFLFAEEGVASWYSAQSCRAEGMEGIFTASGERFNENELSCAMRSRDFGTYYKVTNLENGKWIIVRHNDFGPNEECYEEGRIIDLSKGAFARLAPLSSGLIKVKVERLNL
ncbi:MAG: septal ring lytic transglycosylase RlpA family lipoprotein [Candidatus Omnitrophica bacterium CG07_land_8_20_14_0_80_42_15]|uniref:Septal ring lytic transglycosylase RlpA family lipoprotein n=1 Tax=Candidatus Aquitaenariimonas noxiae TaxID=1974741 RepID=A0A2J0KWH2_9BACT|nr:MAG: septal ring lytic transglycosylase RlpA family lipoprotein [Candidatus Omnitrophica bacterium CG07_land_8_20_14_0_80_42_15]